MEEAIFVLEREKKLLESCLSRKKETKFENEKYEIFKGELERGGSSK